MEVQDKHSTLIDSSNYISRDLSWLQFNYRVLDQCRIKERSIQERLKFLAITSSNLDEFFMIRVGSLYNYLDYGKDRIDYSGLRENAFKLKLFKETQDFVTEQQRIFVEELKPEFKSNDFNLIKYDQLQEKELTRVNAFFKKTIYPMLTPMVYDSYHTFPVLMNCVLTFGVVTKSPFGEKDKKKISFVQIPQNLSRFFLLNRRGKLYFLPIEEIIRANIQKLFRNIEILDVDLFRITRNGDFTLEESDDMDSNFIDEVKKKLKTRKTGRVVRIEIQEGSSKWLMKLLKKRWDLEENNIFIVSQESLLDYTGLWQLVKHPDFREVQPILPEPVLPLAMVDEEETKIFELLKKKDILLHHPYNSIEPVMDLIEEAADDPNVLSIKLTIYRLAKNSRVTAALLNAAENGKHVSVLFEVKARFDEENNIREAQKLQRAGCFVIFGISSLKTHTKLLLIVRKEGEKVTRYVHLATGNYNEDTARLYTDIGVLSTRNEYAEDVSEFFNVITGHSLPTRFSNIITAPRDMREQLVELIQNEAINAKAGKEAGIVIKINSLQDKEIIDELYEASRAGVRIQLIVRGICCIRPGRPGLSENITIRSIVGEYLEHSRIYYFHNQGNPKVYAGSADIMVRSFDRRLESLFLLLDEYTRKEAINILIYNLRDNVNTYQMHEDGSYTKVQDHDKEPFNIHKEFFQVDKEVLDDVSLLPLLKKQAETISQQENISMN